ncbi:MAG: hypothetical protein ACREK5_02060 [Gemmatimonadota bacterium]
MEEESLWSIRRGASTDGGDHDNIMSRSVTLIVVAVLSTTCSDDAGEIAGGEGFFGPTVSGQVLGPAGAIEGALVTGLAWSNNRCGGPGGVFDMDSVRTVAGGNFEFELKSHGGGLPGTSVDFLCIVITAEPPTGAPVAPDTMTFINYEVFLFVPQEIEANFLLQPLSPP